MQQFIGVVVLLIVLAIAAFVTVEEGKDKKTGRYDIVKCFFLFLGMVCACYAVMMLFFGFFWCLAQIGIWLRQAVQWVIDAILLPLWWIF